MASERSLPFFIHESDIPLIVSIASFGMLAGSLVAGPAADLVGRKWSCVFGTCLMLMLGYALIPTVRIFLVHISEDGVGFTYMQ